MFAQSPSLVVKTIICPNLCKGEIEYRLVFEAINGTVSTNRGKIQNDTIVGVLPETDYKLTLTFTSTNAQVSTQIVDLPVCDPVLPLSPLVGSQSICSGTSITPFTAFTVDGATVDWYAQPTGGTPLQTETLQFTPTKEGTYYARARFAATGCTSISLTPVTLEIKKAVCPVLTIRKVRK
ncbi:immunoglobulin domain-containing protein [Runella sp.]|uniref:immunoglobulin domain-containing protein n=1 Tax=Runella sp. TaxID=1960881 RepID=UPI003D0B4847